MKALEINFQRRPVPLVHPLDPPLHKVTLQMTEQKRFAKGIMSESRCAIRKFSAQLEGKGGRGGGMVRNYDDTSTNVSPKTRKRGPTFWSFFSQILFKTTFFMENLRMGTIRAFLSKIRVLISFFKKGRRGLLSPPLSPPFPPFPPFPPLSPCPLVVCL